MNVWEVDKFMTKPLNVSPLYPGFCHNEVAPHREQEIHFSTLLAGQRGVCFIEKELSVCLNVC